MAQFLTSLGTPPLVADGGWSSVLRARGFPADQPAELGNQCRTDLVRALARDYLRAGVSFLSTNTFAANRWALRDRGCDADPLELCRLGAQLAREAIVASGTPARVAGVIGPSGRMLALREVDPGELRDGFSQQAHALKSGGADLIVLETFSELAEVLVAIEAARTVGLPVVACMSFDSGPQRTRTVMGATAEEFARAAERAGVDAVGCNCGHSSATALPAVVALRSNTDKPLWAKPSAGLPDLVEGRVHYPQTPDEFCGPIPQLVAAGAVVVGGCCGVFPEHVQRLSAVARSLRRGGISPPPGPAR